MNEMKQHEYEEANPAFEGTLKFDMTLEILGERFTRQIKVDYKHTPDEEFYDLRKRALRTGLGTTAREVSIRPEPNVDDPDKTEFEWIAFNVFFDLEPDELRDKIMDKIEEHCREEDARRRTRHLKST